MSELRQDLVSGDWIILATGRAKRPHDWGNKAGRTRAPKETCPFEDLAASGNLPLELFPDKNWKIAVTPNKYPALVPREACASEKRNGPYSVIEGIGHHELVITRDHDKNFAKLSPKEAAELFLIFKHRLNVLSEDPCAIYCSLFHAWGPSAGASIYHPHYQILTLPIIPPHVKHSFDGALSYAKKSKKCVHCVMLDHEKKHKGRVIFENADAIAIAPFVSRQPFEVRIFPKKHISNFENTPDKILAGVSEAMSFVLRNLTKKLSDPDYNFFLHTAPLRGGKKYEMYHWHLEVIPKTSILAGFEWSTGIDINIMDPDEAAKVLRS